MLKIVLMTALAGALCIAGSKDKDWQTGKVLDTAWNPYFKSILEGSAADAANAGAPTPYRINERGTAAESVRDKYVIETEDQVFLVERVRLKLSSAANVKNYSNVKVAVEKDKLWLVDADGKQHQTKIVEQKKKAL
jgi:hypothetical protein